MALNAEEGTFAGGSVHMAGGTPEATCDMFPEEALTFGPNQAKPMAASFNAKDHFPDQAREAVLAQMEKTPTQETPGRHARDAQNKDRGKGFERY